MASLTYGCPLKHPDTAFLSIFSTLCRIKGENEAVIFASEKREIVESLKEVVFGEYGAKPRYPFHLTLKRVGRVSSCCRRERSGAHLTCHLSDSLLLADYLRMSCTLHPPPHYDAPPVLGTERRLPPSGGSTTIKAPSPFCHDYINDFEPHVRSKILNSMEIPKLFVGTSEDESDDTDTRYRPDMSYEQYDYEDLEESQQEKDARKLINDYFHASNGTVDPEDAVLDWRTKVNDYSNVVRMLSSAVKKRVSIDHATSPETVVADNFASILAAKLTKRISLPISACMELLSGNLFLRRYMYCTLCNTLLSSALVLEAHRKSKCGGESNNTSLISLFCPPAPLNSEIQCPSCLASVCSIPAFRAHMAIQHGIYVEYKLSNQSGCEDLQRNTLPSSNFNGDDGVFIEHDVSLQDISSRPFDNRSHVARDTDNALWLRNGHLQPRSHFDIQLKLAKRSSNMPVVEKNNISQTNSSQNVFRTSDRLTTQSQRTAFPSLEKVASKPSPVNGEHQHASFSVSSKGLNQQYIKPFVVVNNMLRCKFCAHQTSTLSLMRDHLQSNHVLVCRACGNGFAHREALTRHGKMGRCSMFLKDSPVKHVSADCGVCKKRFVLADAYLHLFREHLSSVVYGTVSGQVFPEHQNLRVNRNVNDDHSVSMKGTLCSPQNTELSKTKNTPEVVLCSCYLCGMEMVSFEQLARHLDKHTEKWARCPFCDDYVPISSHEAMKVHLTQRHMERKDGSWVCAYCQRMLVRGIFAHLLYICTQTRKCALCRGRQSLKNAAEMTLHWTNNHLDILRRFQCTDCGMTFCHLEDFSAHQCRSHFMQQKCSCGFNTVFSSRTAFLVHFGIHMDEENLTCKLCRFKFSSRVALQTENEKRPKRVKEFDALAEEKQTNVDVTFAMRNLIRKVCESLGEPYDRVKLSPQCRESDVIEIDDAPGVDDDLVGSGETPQAALSAEIRVEAADSVSDHGSNMPGYVEDDDDEKAVECVVEGSREFPTNSVVVRKINDEHADDEICVVAEVHESNSHNTDAGGICDKKERTVSFKQYLLTCVCKDGDWTGRVFCKSNPLAIVILPAILLSHGPTGSISCGECSAIAYNTPLYEHHRKAHATPDRLFYGCSQCSMMFRTDSRLMFHLREAHGVPLFFFCKACHLGGTHERTIYAHVAVKSQRCRQFGEQKNWTSIATIGVCPTIALHYQPKNPITYELMIQRGSLEIAECQFHQVDAVVPSECSHRSFLAPTDSLITCRDCFCTMTAASFTAAETYRNGGVSKELAMTLDNGTEFPFTGIYDQTPCEGSSAAPGRAIAPRPISVDVSPSVSNLSNNIRSTLDIPAHTSSPRLPVRSQQQTSSTCARIATVSSLMSTKAASTIKRRTTTNYSDVITLSDDEPPGPSAAKRPPQPMDHLVARTKIKIDVGPRCKACYYICEATMPSAQIQSLHELHRNGMKWFCLDCANAQMDEVEAMKHYFSVHVKVAEQKALERGILFRPLHYELQCPFPKCREPLSTLTNLRIHINHKHRLEASCSSAICMFRFCSPFAKTKHDGQHATYESINGVEGTCCPLCGTLNQWNIQMPGTSYTMSHIAVHGLRRYHMCRDCFVCFKGDYDCVRMKTHFETTHCALIPKTNNRELLCKLCREVVSKSNLTEHVTEKHLVTGFKSRDPKNQGKLVVKTGAVTRRFLGFERIYHAGDDSDMD
ncbi:zinc finger, C2H2 type [Dictyocaulus viviparus]|uniref:Zinc finger, C2H2 type n=1 Tax=Dictyocaulus viviparus TaxID=29172 RepID=A0A0D8Y2F9_DICVI|nr:zinc finger, C2H2 type [Dictyocaulus viviparus]